MEKTIFNIREQLIESFVCVYCEKENDDLTRR